MGWGKDSSIRPALMSPARMLCHCGLLPFPQEASRHGWVQPDAVSRRWLPSCSSLLIQTQGAFPDSARACSGTPLGQARMSPDREGRGTRRRRLRSGIAREDAAVTLG